MRIEERQGQAPSTPSTTTDQILGEIRDYCRKTQTAESTFGRISLLIELSDHNADSGVGVLRGIDPVDSRADANLGIWRLL